MKYPYDYNRTSIMVPTISPVVKILLIANVAVFLVMNISPEFSRFIILNFSLIPAAVIHNLHLWRLVTYMFIHGGFTHILFNMLFLWWFGSELERYWNTGVFIKYYFVTGIGGGLFHLINWNSIIPVVGASGAIMGILLAYGLIWPNRIVLLWFIIPIKMKWLVIISIAIAFLGSIGYGGSGIAHLAHLGGMVVGFIYIKWNKFRWFLKDIRYNLKNKGKKSKFRVIDSKKDFFDDIDNDDHTLH